MMSARTDLLDLGEVDEAPLGRSNPTLVSLHFIRSALRRRWLVCVLCAALGLLLAGAFLVSSPQSHTAKTTLVLAHNQDADPSRAMATDVSLLKTRTVAAMAVTSLGLTMTPDDFLKSVTVLPVSSELMSITLTAPTDAEAIRRLTALNSIYLQFRGEQLTLQSNVLIDGMQQRIGKLQSEVTALSRRIDQLAAAGTSSESTLSDTIAQRAYIQGQIDTLRQSVEDATLRNASVVSSSRVIDPPATDAGGVKRRIALALASGLIGGAALGCGMVLFFAIISDRLRRRADVAAALEVPVPVSVGRISPVPQRLLWLPKMHALDSRRTDERQRLARAIEMELPEPRRAGPVGVICIDNAQEVRFAVARAATDLADDGLSVSIIDLTRQGSLDVDLVPTTMSSTQGPTVLRPRGIPVLAGSMADLQVVGNDDGNPPSLDLTDVTLVLTDLDPSVGADYLVPWTDRVMIAVTAGRSSAEMVRTAADLIRTAGLELRIAGLLHTERTDKSSGTARFEPIPIHVGDGHERTDLLTKSVDESQAADAERAAAMGIFGLDGTAAAHELTADAEQVTYEESLTRQLEQERVDEEPLPEQPEVPEDEESLRARPEQQLANEEALTVQTEAQESLTAHPEQLVDEEPLPEQPQEPEGQESITAQPAPQEDRESLTARLEQEQVGEGPLSAELEQPEDEEALAIQEQISDQGVAVDQNLTVEEPTPVEELALHEEQIPDMRASAQAPVNHVSTDDEDPTVETPAVVDLEPTSLGEPAVADQTQAALTERNIGAQPVVDDQPTIKPQAADLEEPNAEELTPLQELTEVAAVEAQPADELETAYPDKSDEQLSFIENSLVDLGPGVDDDHEFDWSWDWSGDDASQDSHPSAGDADDQGGLSAETEQVVHISPADLTVDGWALYIDVYPPAENGSQNGPASEFVAEADTHEESVRPATNGHEHNGQRRQRRGRKARRRSRSRNRT